MKLHKIVPFHSTITRVFNQNILIMTSWGACASKAEIELDVGGFPQIQIRRDQISIAVLKLKKIQRLCTWILWQLFRIFIMGSGQVLWNRTRTNGPVRPAFFSTIFEIVIRFKNRLCAHFCDFVYKHMWTNRNSWETRIACLHCVAPQKVYIQAYKAKDTIVTRQVAPLVEAARLKSWSEWIIDGY